MKDQAYGLRLILAVREAEKAGNFTVKRFYEILKDFDCTTEEFKKILAEAEKCHE